MPDQEKKAGDAPENKANIEAEQASENSDVESTEVRSDQADSGSNELEAELAAAQEEIAKLKDAFLRAKAEEDNVRRRSEKEIANSRKFAVEGFAKEMMNVYDSLKLACSVEVAEDADETIKSIHDGVEITFKQLGSAFTRFSLQEILPEIGQKPDPNLHQAMSVIDSDEVESGCIVTVIQPGFSLHERLLRPAMVVVAN